MADDDEALERFLAQPAEHGFADDRSEAATPEPAPRCGWWYRVNRFLFEKDPSRSSSISPRRPDGSRVGIFPFNGGGRGR